jgi:hypothetical protein
MQYAKVENGSVTQVGLPKTGMLTKGENTGGTVSGYDKLDEATLLAEGWLPLINNPPVFNPETEYIEHAGYTIGETEVVTNYNVKLKEPVTYEPTELDYLIDLDYRLSLIELGL